LLYQAREYRAVSGAARLDRFEVHADSSDLQIQCRGDLSRVASALLSRARGEGEAAIAREPRFLEALAPLPAPPGCGPVVRAMCLAAAEWEVGPMAAVAGAIAEAVGEGLRGLSEEVIVENGGDLYLRAGDHVTVALYAGERSPFRDRVAFRVDARDPVGVCTSSAVVGPSLSFGAADAVVAVARGCAFADAAATAIANRVRRPADVDEIVELERGRGRLEALIVCCGDRLGLFGNIELVAGGPLGRERGTR